MLWTATCAYGKGSTAARVGAKTNSGAGVRCEKDGGGEWGKYGPQGGG